MLIRTRPMMLALVLLGCQVAGYVASTQVAVAQDAAKKPAEETKISLADGKIVLKAPTEWKVMPPKSQIIQYEFSGPASDPKAENQARITIMGAGGSIADNINRWYGQFEQPDGSATKDKSKTEKFDVAGQTVHFVDIPGNFKDGGGAGPFQRPTTTVMREKYRMLGAIIETKTMGQHFFKITGPSDSVEKLKDGFRKMLEGMEVKP